MRLSKNEQISIKQAALECFTQNTSVRLFGSRTRDDARGGDIDLLIKTDMSNPDTIVKSHLCFLSKLYQSIGEQKIDVIIDYPNIKLRPLIYDVAENEGIIL